MRRRYLLIAMLGIFAFVLMVRSQRPPQSFAETATSQLPAPLVKPALPANLQAYKKTYDQTLQFIEAKNEINAREHAAFQESGWKETTEPPPSQDVLELTDEALKNHLEEVQVHLQTANLAPETLPKLLKIALKHEDAKTRALATEALTTSKYTNSVALIRVLFQESNDPSQREYILRAVLARPGQDDVESFFEDVLRTGSPSERKAALHQLVGAYLAKAPPQARALPQELLTRVPPEFHEEVQRIYKSVLGIN